MQYCCSGPWTTCLLPKPSWAKLSRSHAEILDVQLGVQQQNISEIVRVCVCVSFFLFFLGPWSASQAICYCLWIHIHSNIGQFYFYRKCITRFPIWDSVHWEDFPSLFPVSVIKEAIMQLLSIFFFFFFIFPSFFKFYFIFKLYNIVLVLPNIEMNPPQVQTVFIYWTDTFMNKSCSLSSSICWI